VRAVASLELARIGEDSPDGVPPALLTPSRQRTRPQGAPCTAKIPLIRTRSCDAVLLVSHYRPDRETAVPIRDSYQGE